jgi:periplasmic protein TonB
MDFGWWRISVKSIAMTNKEILQADLLDILFDGRNKQYGAYALRKNYPQRLKWSLGISLLAVAPLTFLIFAGRHEAGLLFNERTINRDLTPISAPSLKVKEVAGSKAKATTQAPQVQSTPIKIVSNNVASSVPTDGQISTAQVSIETLLGQGTEPISGPPAPDVAVRPAEPAKTVVLSQSEAQFPGGKEAFAKFLTKYLVTPAELEQGEKKTVTVRFLVDIDGSISKAQVVQTDGEIYSAEVLRVLRKMPSWIPAMQNGIKLGSWFTQTVSFIGVE